MFKFLTSISVLCLAMAVHANDEDAKLQQVFQDYLNAQMKASPVEASQLGARDYDGLMDDLSAAARQANIDRQQKMYDQLPKLVAYDKLSENGKVDFEIFRDHLAKLLWLAKHSDPFANDPRVWNSYATDSVFLILTQSTAPKAQQVRAAASRIAGIPKVLAEAKKAVKNPPKVYTESAIRQVAGSIEFYKQGIFGITGETRGISALTEPCAAAVKALESYHQFLKDTVLPRSNDNWRLGKKLFAEKLQHELNLDITADQLLADALAESKRVNAEMYVVARQLWSQLFTGKPLPPDDAAGRSQCIQLVLAELGKEHGTVESLVPDAQKTAEEIKLFLQKNDLLRLPTPDRCDIIEMPEFQRGFSTAYLNPAPPLDPKAKSFYAVSPPPKDWDDRTVQSYLQEYNRAMMKLLTIHEAYPGHYVQLEYSNRCPSLVRRILSSGVFAEGWAVYTEQMMVDQGFGKGDLSLRLHQLKWYLRAVTNAILDYRMHCDALSDEDAFKLLVVDAFQTAGEANGKIIRAKLSSCQLSTYFAGRMAFYRLRQAVSREQGSEFHLGRFHEAVLDHGTLPVKYLPKLVPERLKHPR
ncbi:MAG: DUF885 domain-containing protein [Zavarzinella sp.]